MKVKVEKVGHMPTLLRLLVFGMCESRFSGRAILDISSASLPILFILPFETNAAESSCSSQPSPVINNIFKHYTHLRKCLSVR